MEYQATDIPIESTITKDQVNTLPLMRYEGAVELIDDDSKVQSAILALKSERLLGFDTESRPTFQKGQNYPPALIQLCGADKVYIFQLLRLQDLEPVFSLLSDEGIIKVGVAIRDDIRKLQEVHPFEPAGFLELADLTQKVGVLNTGLRSLAGILLGFRISKGAQVSNWAKRVLTDSQVNYAATDAWVSRLIYEKLAELGCAPTL